MIIPIPMNMLNLEKLQKARYERLRSTLYNYLEEGPEGDMAKGILELALYKRPSLSDKIKYLENEVSIKALKINSLAQKQSEKVNNLLNLD